MTAATFRLTLWPLALATHLACSDAALADTGTLLDFDIGLRVQSDSNPDLTPVSPGTDVTGGVDLSFSLTSETALSRLSLTGSLGLLSADEADGTSGFSDPGLTLSYARTTATAALTLDVGLQDAAGNNGAVTNFDTGTGRQQIASLNAALQLGTAGPLGFGLNAGVTDLRYRDTSDPALLDSRTVTLAGDLRRDLSPVLHLTLGLDDRRFDQDGADLRETQSLDLGLTLDRPTGALGLEVTAADTPEGQRLGASFEHQIDLAAGSVTYSLGATRGVRDRTYVTGALNYAQELPGGSLTLGLLRAVQPSPDTDAETLLLTSSLGYRHAVTPNANLALALNWAEQRDTSSDLATANTNLSATWTQSLTPDWALDLGYTHLLRNADTTGHGQSDQVSLTLHRAFSLRF